ncbi:TlpA family protein disulfide reductase [Alkalihalobacterium bogoriense]|uniref:TlpA family protein disulfide reductase n=1 Tax=Alkalihalobacterium bogoriense TaxID=246272 RepID=UPI001FE002D3|nr:TlpA disulfide reductase family protein [Alkalihalobacterium bogoriense]
MKQMFYFCALFFLMFGIGMVYEQSEPVFQQVEKAVAATASVGAFEGKQAVPFTLKDKDGSEISLQSFQGKRVIVNFFATWCLPCQEEMPALVKYEQTLDENTILLGVNLTSQERSKADVEPFLNHFNANFEVLYDETGEVMKQYSIFGIPTTVVINENGVIEKRINGMVTEEMLEEIGKSK